MHEDLTWYGKDKVISLYPIRRITCTLYIQKQITVIGNVDQKLQLTPEYKLRNHEKIESVCESRQK